MRLLVCGGRGYEDFRTLARCLDQIEGVTLLMTGGAPGADRLAIKWAETRNVPIVTFPANWRLGKKAGPLRNQLMLEEGRPDVVVAFPGGRGTADMVRRAETAGVRILNGVESAERAEMKKLLTEHLLAGVQDPPAGLRYDPSNN